MGVESVDQHSCEGLYGPLGALCAAGSPSQGGSHASREEHPMESSPGLKFGASNQKRVLGSHNL